MPLLPPLKVSPDEVVLRSLIHMSTAASAIRYSSSRMLSISASESSSAVFPKSFLNVSSDIIAISLGVWPRAERREKCA
jgi:hypothetical protein